VNPFTSYHDSKGLALIKTISEPAEFRSHLVYNIALFNVPILLLFCHTHAPVNQSLESILFLKLGEHLKVANPLYLTKGNRFGSDKYRTQRREG
jgi:hypothetical protein